MKLLRFLPLVAALCVAVRPAMSQQPPVPGAGVNAALTKLFGEHKAFSAKANVELKGTNSRDDISLVMNMSILDGRIRSDMDMAEMKSAQIPAEAVAGLSQMGMSRLSSIVKPDDKLMVIIYPGLKAYVEMPLPAEEVSSLKEQFKIEKSVMGKEAIDGRPTVKHKVTITNGKGEKQEAITWNAPDLKDFPVKVQTTEKNKTITMVYSDVKLARPDALQFVAPQGFTKHDNIQSLMQAAMLQMLGGAGKQ